MPVQKDYYKILGVDKNSTADDIKKAYRKLAREHHPDMVQTSDKKAAEERFKEISEAYQVLSDPQKRKMYDQYGTAGPNNGFGNSNGNSWGPFSYTYTSSNGENYGFGDFDPFDIFEDIFGFRGYNSQRTKKGKNLYYQMDVSFKEAIFGVEKEVNIEIGKVKIKIPQGARDGLELKFPGKGMPGMSGFPPGDLFITLRVKNPSGFKISGDNLFVTPEVDIVTATIGGYVEVPIIDLSSPSGLSKTKLKIPSGTQYADKFILRGKGMPKLRGNGQGDILVQVIVVVPKSVSRKQKKILEDFYK